MKAIEKNRQTGRWIGAFVLTAAIAILGYISANSPPILPSTVEELTPRQSIGELVGSSRACQTFVARYDGLSLVEVKLATYRRQNSGPFYFSLRTTPDAPQDILALTHDASDVEDHAYHAFEFPPLTDSAGRSYCFCLEAPEAELLNSITAIGPLRDTYPDGQAVFRDMWGEDEGVRDLDFHLGYRLSLADKFAVLLGRLSDHKPLILGDRWFYVLLGVAYLVLLYLLFVQFIPEKER